MLCLICWTHVIQLRDTTRNLVMKIALAIKNFSLKSGGGERYCVELATSLVKRGHEVVVFAANFDCTVDGVEKVRVPMVSKPSILRQWSFNFFFQKIVKKHSVDCVYALTECYPVDAVRLGGGINRFWLEQKHDSALLCMWEKFRLRNRLKTYIEDRMFSPGGSLRVVLNSELCRGQALKYYPVMGDRLKVIYNGKDIILNSAIRDKARMYVRQNHGLDQDHKVFLFMANNFRRKGLGVLLRAFSRICALDDEARLIVAGKSSSDLRQFAVLCDKLKISDKVIFSGSVKEPVKYFCAADCFVLPTRYDPFANVCLEAMACRTGVITSSANGAAEVLADGGVVADSEDEIFDAMKNFLDFEYCLQTGKNAYMRARDFTLEKNAFNTINLLNEICEINKKRKVLKYVSNSSSVLYLGEFKETLESLKLREYADFSALEGGTLIKKNDKRQVRHVLLEGHSFYVKEQFPVSSFEALKMLSHFEFPFSQSKKEWDNLLLMQKLGIDSAVPVCCGWQKGLNSGSFMWMKDIGPARRVEDVFAKPVEKSMKRYVTTKIAQIARVLHRNRYVHKDFYLGHVFLEELGNASAEPRIWLLDVQRVTKFSFLKTHWIVKDLSALYFSSLPTVFSNTDRLRFYLAYAGKSRLGKSDKILVGKILRKSAKVILHTEKLLARRKLKAAQTA